MPGRTRPIEKFAEAVAKCSAEVRIPQLKDGYRGRNTYNIQGLGLWKMHCSRLQRDLQEQVLDGIHEAEELLHCMLVSLRAGAFNY